jgi:molybdopterin adenylyltransferase
MKVAVLTVSDRSAKGEREDRSGPALRALAEAQGWQVAVVAIVPDEQQTIERTLAHWADNREADLILTTGGTGFAPRDITPEATLAVVERQAPGLAEAMRAAGLRVTPHAMLSRGIAGIRGRSLIVNLPGSPQAAREGFEVILTALPHAIALLSEQPEAEAGHRPPPSKGRT